MYWGPIPKNNDGTEDKEVVECWRDCVRVGCDLTKACMWPEEGGGGIIFVEEAVPWDEERRAQRVPDFVPESPPGVCSCQPRR